MWERIVLAIIHARLNYVVYLKVKRHLALLYLDWMMLPSEATGTDESENVVDARGSNHLPLSFRDNVIWWTPTVCIKEQQIPWLTPCSIKPRNQNFPSLFEERRAYIQVIT